MLIMDEYHKIPYSGHSSYQKMITTMKNSYYWEIIKKEVAKYIVKCLEWQYVKVECKNLVELLQPIPIPELKCEIMCIYVLYKREVH